MLLVRGGDFLRMRTLTRQWLDLLNDPFTTLIDDASLTKPDQHCDNHIQHEDLWSKLSHLSTNPEATHFSLLADTDADALALCDAFNCPSRPEKTARIDCVVSIVDAGGFFNSLIRAQFEEATMDIDRYFNLVEWCDVIVLDEFSGKLSADHFNMLIQVIGAVNPNAKILVNPLKIEDVRTLFNCGLYSEPGTSNKALIGQIREIAPKEAETTHFSENRQAVLYRRKRPFHPQRLEKLVELWPEKILRTNGLLWIASRTQSAIEINQYSRSPLILSDAGDWLSPNDRASLLQDELFLWDGQHGDRHNEIVLIGEVGEIEMLVRLLDECLLNEVEMRMNWKSFTDRLPSVLTEPEAPHPSH